MPSFLSRCLLALLLLAGQSATAGITLVQKSVMFYTGSSTSITCSPAAFPGPPACSLAPPTVGNTIVVMAWSWNYTAPTLSVTDNAGNTYTAFVQPSLSSIGQVQNTAIFVAPVTNTVGANFTVTVTSAVAASQIQAVVSEYSGVSAIDQFNGVTLGSPGSTSPTVSTVNPTSVAGEVVWSAMSILNPASLFSSIAPLASYTELGIQLNNSGLTAGEGSYLVAPTTGVQTNTWTPKVGGTATAVQYAAAIVTFSPNPLPPILSTVAASGITQTGATLNGIVTSNGATTNVSFGYGLTTSYGSTCTASPASFASNAVSGSFSCTLSGLFCGTTYHFQATGTNSAGTANGGDLSFTTTACSAAFSAYESGITNAQAATTSNRIIKTRIATTSGSLCRSGGTLCSLTVANFTAANVVNTAYAGQVNVSLQYCTNVSRSGTTVSCGGTWAAVPGVATQTPTLAAGVATVTFPFANNAYEVVRVMITDTTPPIVPGGPWYSNDYFAIRPGSLALTATDGTSSTAGNARSLTSGTVTHNAGAPFTLNAQALATAAAATNYPGTGVGPVVLLPLTGVSPTGTGAVIGTLAPGAWTASGGTETSNTATYSDVGNFTVTLQDQDYANIDINDGSTTTERYFSGSASLSRFTPDHFKTVLTQGCSSGNFTYSGQPFTLQVTALNASGSTTINYDGSANTTPNFAKALTLTEANGVAGSYLSTSIPASAFLAGVANATPTFTFTTNPTIYSVIKPRVTDTDSISSATGTEGTTNLYSGWLSLTSYTGAATSSLQIPVTAFYWSGKSWVKNSSDSCTVIPNTSVALSNYLNGNSTPGSWTTTATGTTLSGGSGFITLTAPFPGGSTGSVSLALNLGSTTTDNACIGTHPATTGANIAWLRGKNGSGSCTAPDDPSATATFGVFSPESTKVKYMRELY